MKTSDHLISVSLLLRGVDLDPKRISEKLKVDPDRRQKRGDPKPKSPKYIAKIGVWAIAAKSESRPLYELVDEVLARIGNIHEILTRIDGVEQAHLDIFYALNEHVESNTIEFDINEYQLKRVAELGLTISVTATKISPENPPDDCFDPATDNPRRENR